MTPSFRFYLKGQAHDGSTVYIGLGGNTDSHQRLDAIVNVLSTAFTMAGGVYPGDKPDQEPAPDVGNVRS